MPLLERLVELVRPYQFRGKARLVDWMVASHGERRTTVFGYEVSLDLNEHIQRMMFLGCYERKETASLSRYLRRGMIFVDVGANVGYYTLAAARMVGPTGFVFAAEPSPYAAAKLARTIVENNMTHVQLCRCAMSDARGEAVLYDASPENHSPTMVSHGKSSGVSVPVCTLDDCLAEWNIDRVDLLKIDVEGLEPRVLAGASRALDRGSIRAILIELNDHWLALAGSSARQLFDRLTAYGFHDTSALPRPSSGTVTTRLFMHELLL